MKTPEQLFRRARSAQQAGDAAGAIRLYRDTLKRAPGHLDATYMLGTLLAMTGALAEAVDTLRRAAELAPESPLVRTNLGLALKMLGRDGEAETELRAALAIDPDLPQAANNLASLLIRRGLPAEAEALARRAAATPEAAAYAAIQIANATADQARVGEALTTLQQSIALQPDHALAWSNFLSLLHYDPARSDDEIRDWHRRWAARFPPAPPPPRRSRGSGERLRVGYLSSDFRLHPVGMLAEPVLAAHDPTRVEVVLYHDSRADDALTRRLRTLPGVVWRPVGGLADAALGECIRADRLDLLVETSGHLAGNRLPLLAGRPAPVQATWLGYPGSTGLPALDYAISDALFDPPSEANAWYAERLVRLARPSFCFAPPAQAPAIGWPAAPAPRFGAFNNLRKLNAEVIGVWAQILRGRPDAVLVIQALGLADPELRRALLAAFGRHGVDPGQLELHGHLPFHEHLELLATTHLGLDPWPWNGHMTTLNSLWMGVPVLTLAGRRRAARMGLGILAPLGLDDFVADSPATYVDRALALAADLPRLQSLRGELRQRLGDSVLCDGSGLARALEDAYAEMCRG